MNITKGEKCRATSELMQSQAHIVNHLFSFINSMSLKSAVELNIPDIIHAHARPMTLINLIEALELNPTKASHMHRLMCMLIHSGFFTLTKTQEVDEENQEEGYLLTPAGRLLLKDESASLRTYIIAMLDPLILEPWQNLSRFLKNSDKSVFETTNNGTNLWEYLGNDEKMSGLFNDSMAKDSAFIGKMVVEECGRVFEGLRSVVDVGGGTGTLARIIAGAFPEIELTVLELPHVVANLEQDKDLKFVGGDMFESIPSADAILLKWILHDWSDEECVKILKNCKKAIPAREKGGKVIIIDMVVDSCNVDNKSMKSQLFYDMVMMVFVGGRERDEKNWSKIFIEAGFSEYKITNIGSRSIIEVYA